MTKAMRLSGFVLLFSAQVLAHCYVLQNNTNTVQTWHFQYSKPLDGAKTVLKLGPHASFPANRQWCWDTDASYYAVASVDPPASAAGAYTPSWQGTLVIGNGTSSNVVSASP
jgi:hypothetical protein